MHNCGCGGNDGGFDSSLLFFFLLLVVIFCMPGMCGSGGRDECCC